MASGEADGMSDLNRIRWKCRRGTLELDLLLTDFVDRHYRSLSRDERDEFIALLERGNDELWTMINTEDELPGEGLATILERLRAC
jgi:succinate dehydrogenase flavin-adding protein (antitoxin of CptAB toxin-antitoxin module)